MKKDTITITRAEYAQLNKAANAAVEHACELLQAARLVDELEARKEALEAENAALKNRVAGLEKFSRYLSKKRDEKKEEFEEMKDRREANLKWVKNLVHSAWMLAEREGVGEEALEELEHIRDMVSYTVANMLQDNE